MNSQQVHLTVPAFTPESQAKSHPLTFPEVDSVKGQKALTESVGLRLSAEALSALSDAELQDYITDTSGAFLAAHCRYLKSSCLADKGERDGLYLAQRAALLERKTRLNSQGEK